MDISSSGPRPTDVASLVVPGAVAGDILVHDGTSLARRAQGAAGTYWRRTQNGLLGYYRRPEWESPDHGYIAESFRYQDCLFSSTATVSGRLNLTRLHIIEPRTITNLYLQVTVAGATFTAGQNFAALYSLAGALLGISADQSTPWASGGLKQMALAGGPVLVSADVYVGWWSVATTPPQFGRAAAGNGAAAGADLNKGLSAPTLRYATADTGLTTTAPPAFGAQTALNVSYWAAVD